MPKPSRWTPPREAALVRGRARNAMAARRSALPGVWRLMTAPAIVVVDLSTGERTPLYYGTSEHQAHLEWARFHGLDPMTIPAGSEVMRDPERNRVLYEQFVYDPPEAMPDPMALVLMRAEDGAPIDGVRVGRIEQGEAPPLPFP